jgi:hypothetical protein
MDDGLDGAMAPSGAPPNGSGALGAVVDTPPWADNG